MLRKLESQIALAVNARMQFVSVSNAISNTLIIRKGVPQGSILGLFLLLIYINVLPNYNNLLTFLFVMILPWRSRVITLMI
jgi:hypothetical protein